MKERFLAGVCVLLAVVFTYLPATAQEAGTASHGSPAVFAPLDLPAPNAYRSASGSPTNGYWQQRADYRIQVRLDPAAHRLSGSETITYVNNSPDTLTHLWLQLDQNLFRSGSEGASVRGTTSRWRGAFEGGGYDLPRIELVRDGTRVTPEYLVDDTQLRITLDQPLLPGGDSLGIEIDFAFTIPEYGADRMGRLDVSQGTVYQLAQWYPRMFVYDDVDGWNVMPYLGQGEFYLEYGSFDVSITVPRDFLVAATGVLQNPEEVLTGEQRRRLARARESAETVVIVAPQEIGQPGTRPPGDDALTWHFRAENVRDFAWAASQAFVWDAASWEDVLLQSFYPVEGIGEPGRPGWEESTAYVRHSVAYYSEAWFRYPYPTAINVAGIVGGMEYPMIVFCDVDARDRALFGVTDHEIGHTWFPMIVGNDERRHAWMDEGFNTFMNFYSERAFYEGADADTLRPSVAFIAGMMQTALAEQPITTYPDRIREMGLGFLAYNKPGLGLVLLREYILGRERFDSAFRTYIDRWAYRHPQPADFFRTIEDVSGEDLDWFWRGWFYSTERLDQAVTAVSRTDDGTVVTVTHREGLVLPVELEITYTNGTSERRQIPAGAFATSDTFHLSIPDTRVTGVVIDPDVLLPDIDRENNVWRAGDEPSEGVPAEPRG